MAQQRWDSPRGGIAHLVCTVPPALAVVNLSHTSQTVLRHKVNESTYFWPQVMHDADMMKVLPRIACPTLLVAGEKDFRWGA